MSGFFQNLLKDTASGFFGNEYLRDFTHASKTFRTNAYGYSPKFKFLFHVFFDINESMIAATKSWPQDHNFGLAVKQVQLPKYSFDLHTLNQYNRKRIIQTKIKYDPINIVFHDDNSNLINRLWYTYYTYYYKDAIQNDVNVNKTSGSGSSTDNLNKRNIYDPSQQISSNDWGYIGEGSNAPIPDSAAALGSSKPPFFKAINIYGFNQHNFSLYRLVNPMIESFSHDTYDYSQSNGTMEHQMSIQYETVKYYEGAVDGRTPSQVVYGFGDESHYDKSQSPISVPGSNASILGQGGLVSAAGGILDDLENGNYLGAIRTAGIAAKTFKNPSEVLKIAKGEVLGMVTDSLKGTPNRNNLFNFPLPSASGIASARTAVNSSIGSALGKSSPPAISE